MKNIHVLPTNKPSKLYKEDSVYKLDNLVYGAGNQNIYITSDEEIKEGDWVYSTSQDYNIQNVSKGLEKAYNNVEHYSKIILTTDADLIKDGVQAIDDEFLEWFVKNPSCEFVKIEGHIYKGQYETEYKIIIPKEEYKQEFLKQKRMSGAKTVSRILEEPKQETLEEVAERLYPNYQQEIFIKGAKWQSERMYSEEEVRKMFSRYNEVIAHRDIEEWQPWIDKQFKKK